MQSPIALRMMGEHYSSQPYEADFSTKNLNTIRHILDEGNQSNKWSTSLRTKINIDKIKHDLIMNKKYYKEKYLKNK